MKTSTLVILLVASLFLLPEASKIVYRLMYPSLYADFSFVIALALEVILIILVNKFIKKFYPKENISETGQAFERKPEGKSNRQWLKVLSFIYGALVVITFIPAMFAFGEPFRDILTFFFSLSLAAIPLSLLISCIGGFTCSSGEITIRKKWMGWFFTILPIINLLFFVIMFVLTGAT